MVKLKDQNGKLFYDKLIYIYLEMPHFNLDEQDLKSSLDKWLFFLKHLENFQSIPSIFQNEIIFMEAFQKAELAKLAPPELGSYENSLKIYRDLKNVIDTARDEGQDEGRYEGRRPRGIEMATELKINGVPIEIIVKTTGLSEKEINNL